MLTFITNDTTCEIDSAMLPGQVNIGHCWQAEMKVQTDTHRDRQTDRQTYSQTQRPVACERRLWVKSIMSQTMTDEVDAVSRRHDVAELLDDVVTVSLTTPTCWLLTAGLS